MKTVIPILAMQLLLHASCSSGTPTSKSKKEATTEQPTEVAGGFGLTMQCSIINKDVEDAESSSIRCLVYNDDGSRYSGSIDGTTADIVKASGEVVSGAKIFQGAAAGSYSIGVDVANMKPGDAATIRVSAKFNNSERTLVSSLKGRLATTCDDDVTYYVNNAAGNVQNLFCTQDAPCSTINRALNLITDIVNCKITVDIAAGTYIEKIQIFDKQIMPRGSLIFAGQIDDKNRKNTILVSPVDTAAHIQFFSFDNNAGSGMVAVSLHDLRLRGPGTNKAIVLKSSALSLRNVEIDNYTHAVTLGNSSTGTFEDLTLTEVKQRGIVAEQGTQLVLFKGVNSITGALSKVSVSIGVDIQGASRLNMQSSRKLSIDNFDTGLLLKGTEMAVDPRSEIPWDTAKNGMQGSEIEIKNVGIGINLLNSRLNLSSAMEKKYDTNYPFSVSIKNFSRQGLYLNNSRFADDSVANDELKPNLILEGSSTSSSELILALNTSVIRLSNSNLTFCLQNSLVPTPWNENSNRAFYAITVIEGSNALFDWKENPFRKNTSSCNPANLVTINPSKLFIKTYGYMFAAPPSGCPVGYFMGKDNCYSTMGYGRYLGTNKYFGVFEDDSQLDNL